MGTRQRQQPARQHRSQTHPNLHRRHRPPTREASGPPIGHSSSTGSQSYGLNNTATKFHCAVPPQCGAQQRPSCPEYPLPSSLSLRPPPPPAPCQPSTPAFKIPTTLSQLQHCRKDTATKELFLVVLRRRRFLLRLLQRIDRLMTTVHPLPQLPPPRPIVWAGVKIDRPPSPSPVNSTPEV